MKLKGFNKFINESEGFKPIDVDVQSKPKDESVEEETTAVASIEEGDIDVTEIIKKEFPTEMDRIMKSINSLQWELLSGQDVPAAPGLNIKGFIEEFKVPKVDMVAYSGEPRADWIFGTEKEPGAAYTVLGVQGNYANGTYRLFFVDGGNIMIPVGGMRMDASESDDLMIKEGIVDDLDTLWMRNDKEGLMDYISKNIERKRFDPHIEKDLRDYIKSNDIEGLYEYIGMILTKLGKI